MIAERKNLQSYKMIIDLHYPGNVKINKSTQVVKRPPGDEKGDNTRLIIMCITMYHSVHWGINIPLKTSTALFLAKSPFDRETVQAPSLGKPLLYIDFS